MLITTILSVLAWMSLSLTAMSRLKSSYAAGLMFTACAIILVLFLGMILGHLSLTYYAVIIGAFVQAMMRGWSLSTLKAGFSRKTDYFKSLKSSYALLYLLALATIVVFTRKIFPDFAFFGWDEFSHWARYTKILVNTSVAPVNDPAVLFPAYPPGINLWHYFICGPGGYAEWKVIFAQLLLVTSVIAFISTNFDKLKGLGALIVFIFGVMLYHAFGTSLYEIYTDCVLGLMFGAALITARHLSLYGTALPRSIAFGCLLATLSLIKPITLLFTLTACGLFLTLRLTLILMQKLKKKPANENSAEERKIRFGRSLIQTAQFLAAGFSTVFIWKGYLSFKSVSDQLAESKEMKFSDIYEFLFTRDTKDTQIAWQELSDRIGFERVSNFGEKQFRFDYGFFNDATPIYHGAVIILLVAIGAFILRAIINYKKAITTAVEGLFMTVTFFLYLLVVVFTIRHYFQPWDIAQLASLERYLSSFLIGTLMLGFAVLASDASNLRFPKFDKLRALALPFCWAGTSLILLYVAPISFDRVFGKPLTERTVPSVYPWANEYDELVEIREQVKILSGIVKANAEPEDKVYVIAQNETGYTLYMSGHELTPLATNPNCFSVGEKYSEADNWTCDWMNFPIVLQEYDYLILRRADEEFWTQYGEFFAPAARGYRSGVFKVDSSGEAVSLETIYLSDEGRGVDSPM
ncbi:MAG: hypothetical protein ABJN69_10705 [Hellea sp.]